MSINHILIKNLSISCFVIVIMCLASRSWAADYYVDSVAGADTNSGTQAAPYKTVAKVNGLTFRPGDNIYFKCGGVWSEVLQPDSGISGNHISYGSYGIGNKPRLLGFGSTGKSYVNVKGFEFRNGSNYQPVKIITVSHHITIDDCVILADTTNTSNAAAYILNSHHISIMNSKIAHLNLNSQGDALILHKDTQYCLIFNNSIGSATHYAVTLQGSDSASPNAEAKFNILRKNIIDNPEGALLELQSNANNNVVEGNIIKGGKSVSYNINLPRSLKNVSKNNIVRYNIFKDNTATTASGIAMEVYAYTTDPPNIATGNHIYNNVITNIAKGPVVISTNGDAGSSAYNNTFKNNAVYNNPPSYQLSILKHVTIYDNYFINNLFYKSGVTNILQIEGVATSVAGIQSSNPTDFRGNLQLDPKLDTNFIPLSGSPCIDGGDFLTSVTSPGGTGNTLTVADSRYFTDGFGIVSGDIILVGSETASIVSIDYATNTLTLAETITWKNGDPVSLPYSGAKPDIGANEYTTALPKPQNLRLIN